jgi:hypothetical protein
LKYLIADTTSVKIDDDGYEVGVNGTIGGFSTIIVTAESMTVTYYNQKSEVLYVSSVTPRTPVPAPTDPTSIRFLQIADWGGKYEINCMNI